MNINIIDEKNSNEIWSELNLSSLLVGNDSNNNILSLQQQIEQIELKNAERLQDPLLKKHIKKWKKPSYSILKERYNAKPIIPPKIHKSKIEKLADPLRGKYSAYDKLLMDDRNDYSNNNMNNNNNSYNNIRNSNIYDNVPESSPRSNASSISILLGNDNDSDDRRISPEKAKANKASKTAFFLTETLDNDDNTINSNDNKFKKKLKGNFNNNNNNDRRAKVAWQDPKKIDYSGPKKHDRSNKTINSRRPVINTNTSKKIASSGYGYKPKPLKNNISNNNNNINNNRKAKTNTSINDSVLNMSNSSNRFKTNNNRKVNNTNGLSRVKSTVALLPGGRVKKVTSLNSNQLSTGTRSSRSAPTLPTTNILQGLERIPEVARKETIMRSMSGKPRVNYSNNTSNNNTNNMNMKTTNNSSSNNNNINNSNINNNASNNGKIKITNNEILKWKQNNGKQKSNINNTINTDDIALSNDNNARSIATNTTTANKTYIVPKGTTEILATLEKIEKVDSLRNHKENIRYISNSRNKDSDITQLMAKVSKIGSKLADAQSHAAKYKEMSEIFND